MNESPPIPSRDEMIIHLSGMKINKWLHQTGDEVFKYTILLNRACDVSNLVKEAIAEADTHNLGRLWRFRTISIDGGKIGKTWTEKFYRDKKKCEAFVALSIENSKGEFKEDTVEDLTGMCDWRYGIMHIVDEVETLD